MGQEVEYGYISSQRYYHAGSKALEVKTYCQRVVCPDDAAHTSAQLNFVRRLRELSANKRLYVKLDQPETHPSLTVLPDKKNGNVTLLFRWTERTD